MRIQRVPTGLLDFLRLRSEGRTPDNLLDDVRATVDVSPNYDLERSVAVTEPINMATGQIEFIEVPGDEVWKLIALGVMRDAGGTTGSFQYKFTYSVERLLGAGLNGVPFLTSDALVYPAAIGVTGRFADAHTLPKPFFLSAGQRLTVQLQFGINTATGIAESWQGDFWARVVRMKV